MYQITDNVTGLSFNEDNAFKLAQALSDNLPDYVYDLIDSYADDPTKDIYNEPNIDEKRQREFEDFTCDLLCTCFDMLSVGENMVIFGKTIERR